MIELSAGTLCTGGSNLFVRSSNPWIDVASTFGASSHFNITCAQETRHLIVRKPLSMHFGRSTEKR